MTLGGGITSKAGLSIRRNSRGVASGELRGFFSRREGGSSNSGRQGIAMTEGTLTTGHLRVESVESFRAP